jgi:hypothetical protein
MRTHALLASSSRSRSSSDLEATFSRASYGHSVNQSIVQLLIRDGNILKGYCKVFLPSAYYEVHVHSRGKSGTTKGRKLKVWLPSLAAKLQPQSRCSQKILHVCQKVLSPSCPRHIINEHSHAALGDYIARAAA